MSIISGTDLAAHVGIPDGGDSALLAASAAAACRNVRAYCGRSFDVVTASTQASARYYHITGGAVWLDDCTEVTAVALDSGDAATWATSLTTADYSLTPVGGIGADGSSGWPYTQLVTRNTYRFTTTNTTIPELKVTAKWGWAALPDDVRLATLMVGAELFRAKGGSVETFTADGQFIPIRRNALVRDLLREYRGWRSAPAVA